MPLTDVAATLGIPLGTVKSRLHRALREMRSRSRPNPVAVAGPGRAGGMTASTRYERNLPGILDDLSAGPAPEYLDDVFARTGRMRQRPGWTFPKGGSQWLTSLARGRSPRSSAADRGRPRGPVLAAARRRRLATQGRSAVRAGPQRRDRLRLGRRPVRRRPRHGCDRLLVGGPKSTARRAARRTAPGSRSSARGACPQTVDIYAVKADGSDPRKVTSEPKR